MVGEDRKFGFDDFGYASIIRDEHCKEYGVNAAIYMKTDEGDFFYDALVEPVESENVGKFLIK